MKNKFTFIFILLSLFALLLACASPKNAATVLVLENNEKSAPEIDFLYFEIEKRGEETSVRFIERKTRPGVLKSRSTNIRNTRKVLVASFYAGDQFLFEQPIDHPLNKIFEYSHDEKSGLQTFNKEVSNCTFSMRITKDPRITSIKFKEIIDQQENSLNEVVL